MVFISGSEFLIHNKPKSGDFIPNVKWALSQHAHMHKKDSLELILKRVRIWLDQASSIVVACDNCKFGFVWVCLGCLHCCIWSMINSKYSMLHSNANCFHFITNVLCSGPTNATTSTKTDTAKNKEEKVEDDLSN